MACPTRSRVGPRRRSARSGRIFCSAARASCAVRRVRLGELGVGGCWVRAARSVGRTALLILANARCWRRGRLLRPPACCYRSPTNGSPSAGRAASSADGPAPTRTASEVSTDDPCSPVTVFVAPGHGVVVARPGMANAPVECMIRGVSPGLVGVEGPLTDLRSG